MAEHQEDGCTAKMLLISSIRLDFQPEENLLPEVVASYAEVIRRGEEPEPVVVRFDGENYWLQDGFHRIKAASSLGRIKINAEIIPGTPADMEAEWRTALEVLRRDLRASFENNVKREG